MTEKTAKSNAGKGWLCCVAIIALCVISCFAQNGTYTTKKVLGLLGVRLEPRQHPGGVVIVEQLAAELDIQLVAELLPPGPDVLGLEGQVFVVIKTDFHMCSLFPVIAST